MNNKLVTVISFASIFVILATTISILTLNGNAQEETSKNNSSFGTNG
jgi:hypothetical protein